MISSSGCSEAGVALQSCPIQGDESGFYIPVMGFYIPEYGLPRKEVCPWMRQFSSPKIRPGGLIAEDHPWATPPAAGSITLVSAGGSGGHHIVATRHSPNVQERSNHGGWELMFL